MVLVVLLAVCGASLAGWWWLGKTATPGQKALEDRRRAARRALWRTPAAPTFLGVGGGRRARAARDASFWTASPPVDAVPEPPEHQEPWRS